MKVAWSLVNRAFSCCCFGELNSSKLGEITCELWHQSSSYSHELLCHKNTGTDCFHCSCFAKEEFGAQGGPVPCPGITPDAELTWCVAPRLIVGGEDPKVAATDKLLVVHREQGARGGEELRMKNNLAVENKGSARAPYLATPWGSQRGWKSCLKPHKTVSGQRLESKSVCLRNKGSF